MLPSKAVEASTLELIRSLQNKPYLREFYLAGGTALALRLSHRRSIDIDLFSNFDFDAAEIFEKMQQDLSFRLFLTAPNTLKGAIGNINVDILAHRYPHLAEPEEMNGVFLLSTPDIIAMKLNAISISGQRPKDFIDIFFLLDKYTMREMLSYYQKKYGQDHVGHILKSLVYFDDVDLTGWPVLIENPGLTWKAVRNRIEKAVLDYAKHQDHV